MTDACNARERDLRTGPWPTGGASQAHWQAQRNIHASIERHRAAGSGSRPQASGNTSFLTGTYCRRLRAGAPRLGHSDMVTSNVGWADRPLPGTTTFPVLRWIPNVPARQRPRPDTAASAKAASAAAALGRPALAVGSKKALGTRRGGFRAGTEPPKVRSPGSRLFGPPPPRHPHRPRCPQRRSSHLRSLHCICQGGAMACCCFMVWPAIHWN